MLQTPAACKLYTVTDTVTDTNGTDTVSDTSRKKLHTVTDTNATDTVTDNHKWSTPETTRGDQQLNETI